MAHATPGPGEPCTTVVNCCTLHKHAPALLAALNKLVRRLDNGDTIEPDWYEVDEARAAIAAATGEGK